MNDQKRHTLLSQTETGKAVLRLDDRTEIYQSIESVLNEAWGRVEGKRLHQMLDWLTAKSINLDWDHNELVRRFWVDYPLRPKHRSLLSRLLRRP